VLSAELDRRLGLEPGYLEKATGVLSRHVCTDESQIGLAVVASQRAMEDAAIGAGDIDLVLGACGIPYQTLPTTAPLVMRQLGIADGAAAAHDVNSTCLSFLTAFELAAIKIAAGLSRVALVFSSEIASRALPWREQPDVAALFGDGAAAAVLVASPDGRSGIRASRLESYPTAYDACEIGAGGTRFDFHREPENFARHAVFRMDGKELFRVTHRHFPRFVERVLAAAGWSRSDVDLIVPHQANPLALWHMVQHTGMEESRVVSIAARLGNQIAASIPTALDIARRDGRIRPGMKVLLLGTSAGVSFGGMAIEV
jgi:3-oxoacyl-[acyl-carrier-protein] synthase-3